MVCADKHDGTKLGSMIWLVDTILDAHGGLECDLRPTRPGRAESKPAKPRKSVPPEQVENTCQTPKRNKSKKKR